MIRGLALNLVVAATFAAAEFTAVDAIADDSHGESADPDALSFLKDVITTHDFQPYMVDLPLEAGRFAPARLDKTMAERLTRTSELYERLRNFDFSFVAPVQQSDEIEGMTQYLRLKPACSVYPVQYWSTTLERAAPSADMAGQVAVGSQLTPYVPNAPRPVDYEIAYQQHSMIVTPATRNFALYKLPDIHSTGTPENLYVFRAEDYLVPYADAAHRPLLSQPPGSFAAFEYPSCIFRGSVDYLNYCGDGGRFNTEHTYLAEVIEIDQRYYTLTIFTPRCPKAEPGTYFVMLWDLGVGSSSGGSWYGLKSQ
jgi:hypothetical protein